MYYDGHTGYVEDMLTVIVNLLVMNNYKLLK